MHRGQHGEQEALPVREPALHLRERASAVRPRRHSGGMDPARATERAKVKIRAADNTREEAASHARARGHEDLRNDVVHGAGALRAARVGAQRLRVSGGQAGAALLEGLAEAEAQPRAEVLHHGRLAAPVHAALLLVHAQHRQVDLLPRLALPGGGKRQPRRQTRGARRRDAAAPWAPCGRPPRSPSRSLAAPRAPPQHGAERRGSELGGSRPGVETPPSKPRGDPPG